MHGFGGEVNAVLFLDVDVLIVGHHTQDRHATKVFEHFSATVEEAKVTTKLIDNDSLDALSVFWCLENDAAIDGSKDTATVYVAHQNDIGIGMASHGHVDKVVVAEVDFGDRASPFHHDGVVALGEAIEGSTDLLAEVNRPSPRPSPIMGRETIRMVLPLWV